MLVRKHLLVKLLEQADQLYLEKRTAPGRGRPYTYCKRGIFLCLFLKTLDDCSALYHYLSHQVNAYRRQLVGLAAKLPHLKTFQPHFEQSAPLMRRQLTAIAPALAKVGLINFELLALDGIALGPDWHKNNRLYTHIPVNLISPGYYSGNRLKLR
jgi:hypothetical protein